MIRDGGPATSPPAVALRIGPGVPKLPGMELSSARPVGGAGEASASAVVGALEHRLASATSAAEACCAVVEVLSEAGAGLPSVYLERGGLLRCMATRGYWQVLDGMPPQSGIIARTYRTGEPVLLHDARASPEFLEAVPDVTAEACVPVLLGGVPCGALNLESSRPLRGNVLGLLVELAALLSERLVRLGGAPRETRWQRLARYAAALTELRDSPAIERASLVAVTDLSGMSSGLIATTGPDGVLSPRAAHGPLAASLLSIDAQSLATIAAWVAAARSCYTLGRPAGRGFTGHDSLRMAGANTLVVLGLDARGRQQGFLLAADAAEALPVTDVVELLELLASQTASCLQAAAALDELRDRAARDPLTGLGHHAAFGEALSRTRRHPSGSDVAVLLLDVDGFKAVNDREGHLTGDRVLRELAANLAGALREGDRLYRIGGDEFATVLAVGGAEQALDLGERLRQAAAATGRTVSIGVAVGRTDEPDGALLARADAALYEVKRAGRDGVRLAT